MGKQIRSRWVMILARAMDHRIGSKDDDPPELPILTAKEAMISFWIRLAIVCANLIACGAVVANILKNW